MFLVFLVATEPELTLLSTFYSRARLFDLLVSLLPGLDGQEVDTVFSSLKPAMQVCKLIYCIE